MAADDDCHGDHSKLKLIAQRWETKHNDTQFQQVTGAVLEGRTVTALFGEIASYATLLMGG